MTYEKALTKEGSVMSSINIGQEILVLRAEKGWTQQQFAEKLKTSQRTIAAWEAGDSIPRKTMMVKIAQVFGLPPNYFLNLEASGTIDERVGTDAKISEAEREKNVIEDIENLVSSTYQEMNEEKKSQVLEAIQGLLDAIEKK